MNAVSAPLPRQDLRPSGLPGTDDLPWGTHLCQFYRHREDLLETLLPFFEAGLRANERCLWVTSALLPAAEALEALGHRMPDLDERIRAGQIDILDHEQWYSRHGSLCTSQVLDAWTSYEDEARAAGYAGLRISGDTSWLDPTQWAAFSAYEESVHRAFANRQVLAVCTYRLDRCEPEAILDVLRNHGSALVRWADGWEMIESATTMLAIMADEHGRALGTPGSRHEVCFFDTAEYPSARIARMLRAGIARGSAAVALATGSHLEAIGTELRKSGVPVDELIGKGQLMLEDAEAIASCVVNEGQPSRPVFDALVTTKLSHAIERHGSVQAYGEIVDVLSCANDCENAVVLEQWWNELLVDRPIELVCGYALSSFSDAGSLRSFRHVCAAHERVHRLVSRSAAASWGSSRVNRDRLLAELEVASAALQTEVSQHRQTEIQRELLLQSEGAARDLAQHLTQQLAWLQRLTSGLSEVSTLSQIVAIVETELREMLNAVDVAIFAPHEGGAQLQGLRRAASEPHVLEESRALVPLESELTVAEVFRSARPQWLRSSSRNDADPLLVLPRDTPTTLGYLPLVVAGTAVGVLVLALEGDAEPSTMQRALLEDYIRQVAIALDRAHSYENAQRARARLELLAEVAERIARAKLDLPEVVGAVVREVVRDAFAVGCALHLASEEDEALSLAALHRANDEIVPPAESAICDHHVELGKGLIGRVAADGISFRSAHADLLVVPLPGSGGIIGTLCAWRRPQDPPFSAEDQQLLQEIADRAALSVDNALLYDKAQREHARAQRERQRAEAASRAKDEFLAMLGHELRNPLSPILTAVHLMRLRDAEAFPRERTIIERQVNHMVRLVDDLLDVSRITRGKIELRLAPIELSHVVRDAIEVASPLLEDRAHRLVVDVPTTGLLVQGDADRLAQIVVNLLTNSAKYTPPEGLVEVSGRLEDGRVLLMVRDNGVGIDPELLPRVLDLFVQGRQDADRAQGGLGLGLAIARNLAKMHGGSLRASSGGRGQGSTFTLELPLLREHTRPRHESRVASPVNETPIRVLIVDDNIDAAHALGDAMRAVGHIVRVAHDGPSALKLASQFQPELALLDIGLPVMDGYELAERLIELRGKRRLELIAVTGYGQLRDRQRSQAAGFAEHIVKPVDLAHIVALVRRLFAAAQQPSCHADSL